MFSPLVTLTLSENHVIDQRRRYACSQFAPISSLTFKNRETNESPKVSHLRASYLAESMSGGMVFRPLDADHVRIDRVGWVGWIGSGRY